MTLLADMSIGTLPNWLTLVGVAVVMWIFYRGGGATAITSLQAANRVLVERGDKLEQRVSQLEEQARADGLTIADLRSRTDFSVQIHPLLEWSRTHEVGVLERARVHEDRAQDRFEKTLYAMERIAEKIGPDIDQGHPA